MVSSRFLNGVKCATMERVINHRNEEEETEMNITTVGLDVAKKVFHLVGLDVRGQKNDDNDARAIAEAVRAPWMRFVAVKTVEQQDVQSRVRLREGAINARTAE